MSPEARALEIAQRLPDHKRAVFMADWSSKKKDKSTAVVLSLIWLFGIAGCGRFYVGHTGLGLGLLFGGPLTCFIWPLIDTFLIGQAVDDHNNSTLMMLEMVHRG
jgi:TM2 domain-containing membrane protein YozV